MARFKLTLEYEGTRYNGWQFQKNQPTIQGKLFDVCKEVFGTDVFELYGSGRTDRGVHALGQVAHLDVKTKLLPEKIKLKFNDALPSDICILNIEKASDHFHARYDAIARSYVYHISQRRTAFGKPFVWWIKDDLNLEVMDEVATLYTGFRDFHSFSQEDPDEKSTMVEIKSVNIFQHGDSLIIHIVGSHFLWKMVRRMIGIMVEAGRGKISSAEVASYFKNYSPKPAQNTAPPSGLYLEHVYYAGDKILDEPDFCLNIH
jgi:tRNA pseudouridine38-40 synthase